jgi:amino acid transporter
LTLIGLAIVLAFTVINLKGMSEAIKVLTIMNLVELAILMGVTALGIPHIEPGNLTTVAYLPLL